MVQGTDLATADPLGLGGLLTDACRVTQLMRVGAFAGGGLIEALFAAALEGLSQYIRHGDWRQSATQRLAFRELGLAIGLSAIELIQGDVQAGLPGALANASVRARVEALAPYAALGSVLESFWLEPEHRQTQIWREHRDINEVMLATSLVPEGFLRLSPPD
jgi:hypothetical protein